MTEEGHICSFNVDSKASVEKCRMCDGRWEHRDSGGWIKQNRADRRARQRKWRAYFRRQTRESDKHG